jgi:ParB/RepB/Spo0J family partition protein
MTQTNGQHQKVGELQMIPIERIRENKVALRGVDKKRESYVQLVDSIRQYGINNPIVVRRSTDKETGEEVYVVVDGLHRYSAALDAGLGEVPAHVKQYEGKEDVWLAQIVSNAHKVETRPKEYADHINRILIEDPSLSLSELAAKLNKSPEWLQKILNLTKIKDQKLADLVNEGTIKTSNAVYLAQLPEEEQGNFADRAQTLSPGEFIPLATGRLKEIRDARRQGRAAKPEEFVAVPLQRKFAEVKQENEDATNGRAMIRQMNIVNPVDAWKLAIAWVLQVDPKSAEVRKQKDQERKKKLTEEKERKKAERDEQKAREAAREAAEVGMEE